MTGMLSVGEEHVLRELFYKRLTVLVDCVDYWRLTTATRERYQQVFDLLDQRRFQQALDLAEDIIARGEAYAEGYDCIEVIRNYDADQGNGMAQFIAKPYPIREVHYLDKDREIVFANDDTFRIESCTLVTSASNPERCMIGSMLVYEATKVDEAETGEIVVAPWNDPGRVKKRKFSHMKTFLSGGGRLENFSPAYYDFDL